MPRRALVLAAVLGGVGAAPLGWVATDRLEQDNDFCNACHLEPDVPLHQSIRRDFDHAPARSLAGAHGAAEVTTRGDAAVRSREDADFRCIDCHGGASLAGRARVKVLAAKDAFWYVTGRFDEPRHMAWPLWDEDCRKCHASFAAPDPLADPAQRFHALPVHNVDLSVRCVECHRVHEPGGTAETWFLHADLVRGQCARCHPEFEENPT